MTDWRLCTFQTDGGPRAGVLAGNEVRDLEEETVLSLLARWDEASHQLGAAARSPRRIPWDLDEVKLLAPILYPGAIFCAGANYRDHMLEMARVSGSAPEPDPHEEGEHPCFVLKSPPHTVVGPDAIVALPSATGIVVCEPEIGVVIGRPAKRIRERDAARHIAGYTIVNDLTIRGDGLDHFHAKNFDGAAPLGPWITPAEDIEDAQSLGVTVRVNDKTVVEVPRVVMPLSIAEQLAFLSAQVTLLPGDVIATGWPAGGGSPVKTGDVIEISIEGLGTLRTRIAIPAA